MEQPVLALPHRILIVAEGGQGMLDEMRERPLRIAGSDGVIEPVQRSEIVREAGGDQARAPPA